MLLGKSNDEMSLLKAGHLIKVQDQHVPVREQRMTKEVVNLVRKKTDVWTDLRLHQMGIMRNIKRAGNNSKWVMRKDLGALLICNPVLKVASVNQSFINRVHVL